MRPIRTAVYLWRIVICGAAAKGPELEDAIAGITLEQLLQAAAEASSIEAVSMEQLFLVIGPKVRQPETEIVPFLQLVIYNSILPEINNSKLIWLQRRREKCKLYRIALFSEEVCFIFHLNNSV